MENFRNLKKLGLFSIFCSLMYLTFWKFQFWMFKLLSNVEICRLISSVQ